MDHHELHRLIVSRYNELPPVLKRIAEFAIDHPNDIALKPVTTIAARAGVQPSALVRFAKTLGFEGFSDLKRVFQGRLTEHRQSYQDRLGRLADAEGLLPGQAGHAGEVLRTFAEAGKAALDHLSAETDRARLDEAIKLLSRAKVIYILGQRRSFPIAAYFSYALGQADERVVLLDGIGGMIEQQSGGMTRADVLLATSFSPYLAETIEIAERARSGGTKVIAITDRLLSPLAQASDITLEVAEAEVMNFRSLTATFCLAQTLVIGVARQLSGEKGGRRRKSLAAGLVELFGDESLHRAIAFEIVAHDRARRHAASNHLESGAREGRGIAGARSARRQHPHQEDRLRARAPWRALRLSTPRRSARTSRPACDSPCAHRSRRATRPAPRPRA